MKHESNEAQTFWKNLTTTARVKLAKQLKIKASPYSTYLQLNVKARKAIEENLKN